MPKNTVGRSQKQKVKLDFQRYNFSKSSFSRKIVSTVKLFADDMSIFSAVNDANISLDELNKDLQKIS